METMGARRIQVHVVTVVMLSCWLAMAVNAANHQRFGNEAVERSHRAKRSESFSRWSQWFNSDSPENSDGDFETSDSIQKSEAICGYGETVVGAECRIAGSNDTFDSTTTAFLDNHLFQACSSHGLICLNIQQASGMCEDYEVRFRCRGVPTDDGGSDSFFPNFDFKIYIILAVVPVVVVTLRILWSCCFKERLKRRRQRQQQRRRRGHRGSADSESSSTLSSSPSQASIDSALALPPPSYADLFGSRRQSGVFTISQGVGEGTCKVCGRCILPPAAATVTAAAAAPVTVTSAATTTSTTPATPSAAASTTTGSARNRGGLRRIYSFSGPSGATYLAVEDPGFPAASSTTDDPAPAGTAPPPPTGGDGAGLRRIVSFSGPSGAKYLAVEDPVFPVVSSARDSATKPPAAGGTRLRRIVSFSGPSGATVLALAEPVYPVCSSSTADDGVHADDDDVFLESGDGAGKSTNTAGSPPPLNPNATSAPARRPLSSTGSAAGLPPSGDVTSASAPCMCACHTQAQQHGHVNLAFTWGSCDHVDSPAVRGRPPGMHRPVFGFSRIGSVTSFTSFTSFTSNTEPPDYEEALEILRTNGLIVEEEKVAV